MGDFHLNLLNVESNSKTGNFLDILALYSLMPNITKPTRATEETSTLIDIFLDNIKENLDTISEILYTNIIDHFPIFYTEYSSSVDNTEQCSNKLCRQIVNITGILYCCAPTHKKLSQNFMDSFHISITLVFPLKFSNWII